MELFLPSPAVHISDASDPVLSVSLFLSEAGLEGLSAILPTYDFLCPDCSYDRQVLHF